MSATSAGTMTAPAAPQRAWAVIIRFAVGLNVIKADAAQVRDEGRIEAIVRRVRERTAAEGGQPDMMEAVYRHLMEECIAYEHREFARLREGGAQDDRS